MLLVGFILEKLKVVKEFGIDGRGQTDATGTTRNPSAAGAAGSVAPGTIAVTVPSLLSSYTPTPLATCLILSRGSITIIIPSLLL